MSEIARILIPLDQGPLGEAKLPIAKAQARAFGAELILLHVLPAEALDPSGAVSPAEARARTYLDTVAARMRAEGIAANALVRAGATGATIIEEARRLGVGLIVIGSSVRRNLPWALVGTVADEVMRDAPCPVLFVRPDLEAGGTPVIRSFDEDAGRIGPLARRHLGIRTVDVSRIIGSVGRSATLGAAFRPTNRTRDDDQRYRRVHEAISRGEGLPPIELYKLGFGYYVLDGNHRVAIALEMGQIEIDADVTEFIALGDLEAQRTFAERRAFERATGLTRVEAAVSATYPRLLALIDEHRMETGASDLREAARLWYAEVFRPLARRTRQLRIAQRFPGERSAEILLRVAEVRREAAVGWDEALERFAATLGLPAPHTGRRALRLGLGARSE